MGHKSCETSELLVLDNTQSILNQIEKNRRNLYLLIERSGDFTNHNIVEQSQKLDKLLNIYEQNKYLDRSWRL